MSVFRQQNTAFICSEDVSSVLNPLKKNRPRALSYKLNWLVDMPPGDGNNPKCKIHYWKTKEIPKSFGQRSFRALRQRPQAKTRTVSLVWIHTV